MEIVHSEVIVETAINNEMVYKFLELYAVLPQIREIMVSLLQEFMNKLPVLFEDVYLQYQQSMI